MGQFESTDGFRFAAVNDGAADLVPEIAPDDRRRWRMLRYLREATAVVRDPLTFGVDVLDPERALTVPRGYRTDGDHIWPDAMHYYLDRYGIAPPPELADVMGERAYWSPLVSAARVGQARIAVAARDTGPFEPPAPVRDRFPAGVYDVLLTYGWTPGRNASPDVDAWWSGVEPSLPEVPAELAAAGRSILAEFGGLTYPVYSHGPDWPVVGFQLRPAGRPIDPTRIAAAAVRHGGPFFPLGTVFDLRSEIALHPELGVVLVGDVDRFLGPDIDQALIALVQGTAPVSEAQR